MNDLYADNYYNFKLSFLKDDTDVFEVQRWTNHNFSNINDFNIVANNLNIKEHNRNIEVNANFESRTQAKVTRNIFNQLNEI